MIPPDSNIGAFSEPVTPEFADWMSPEAAPDYKPPRPIGVRIVMVMLTAFVFLSVVVAIAWGLGMLLRIAATGGGGM